MKFTPFGIARKTQEPSFEAIGGTITTATIGGEDYKIHTFNSSGTFEVVSGESEVEYLVVAGGGGGGAGRNLNTTNAGGGGAGGLRDGITNVSSGNYSITIGGGGARGEYTGSSFGTTASNGGNSVFGNIVTAIGGGRGGRINANGGNGGSGGGAGEGTGVGGIREGGNGTSGQGNRGGDYPVTFSGRRPGSGGGAGGQGVDGGQIGIGTVNQGGPGLIKNISGSNVMYSRGGNAGSTSTDSPGSISLANRGYGGNAGRGFTTIVNNASGRAGSSGVVIIRYKI